MTPYLQFNRHQWAALRDSVPMTLTEEEITRLKGINEDLSLEEVAEIYLPLSRLLNFYISSNLRRQAVLEQFLGTNGQRIPYIISIAGSVAVGKSTTARVLQALLSRWPEHRHVELITTDGFLHPNSVLKELLKSWYINRFLKFREGAFTDPDSYFHNYAKLSKEEAVDIATSLWNEINLMNLKENILPTRERASLIMTKSANHSVNQVRLRK